ncbi:hypothetical protein DJ533_00340 (plasmid) [Acinetobacter defluvii]|uniref:Uncharacterized protein n=1 Tax=Acinetobacter defluvii TaxID=1871111 RepID=A0A2S2F893_9GAMM|nr:hypothetical protein [Acinetobacter defluvii]AWL27167.1 hypothetical protein DJ533_00340 [Acinetobacter defluvii]
MNELDKVGFNVGEVLILEDDDLLTESTPVITGKFRRGRIDQHMLITKQNIRAKLGHDPRNIYYNNVCDVLENIPAVYVMRIFEGNQILPELPFGKWIISPNVTINYAAITAHYTAYKTNGYDYYDSHADIDLTNAIINSFSDTDMQQWQAFKDAANELTGVTDWVVDAANNQIVYTVTPLYCADGSCEFLWRTETNYDGYKSAQEGCNARDSQFNKSSSIYKNQKTTAQKNSTLYSVKVNSQTVQVNGYTCVGTREKKSDNSIESVSHKVVPYAINPDYSPAEEDKKTLPLETVAQKVISNASSSNQGTSLLVETYIQEIAKSIFNENAAKQFVNLNDLINEFEKNKVVRSIF